VTVDVQRTREPNTPVPASELRRPPESALVKTTRARNTSAAPRPHRAKPMHVISSAAMRAHAMSGHSTTRLIRRSAVAGERARGVVS